MLNECWGEKGWRLTEYGAIQHGAKASSRSGSQGLKRGGCQDLFRAGHTAGEAVRYCHHTKMSITQMYAALTQQEKASSNQSLSLPLHLRTTKILSIAGLSAQVSMQGQQHSALQAVQVASNLAQKGVKEAEFSKQLLDMLDRVMGQSFSMVDSQEMRAQLLSIAQAVKQVRIEISSTFSCAVAHVDKLSHMAKLEEMQPGFPHPPVLHRNILPAAPSGEINLQASNPRSTQAASLTELAAGQQEGNRGLSAADLLSGSDVHHLSRPLLSSAFAGSSSDPPVRPRAPAAVATRHGKGKAVVAGVSRPTIRLGAAAQEGVPQVKLDGIDADGNCFKMCGATARGGLYCQFKSVGKDETTCKNGITSHRNSCNHAALVRVNHDKWWENKSKKYIGHRHTDKNSGRVFHYSYRMKYNVSGFVSPLPDAYCLAYPKPYWMQRDYVNSGCRRQFGKDPGCCNHDLQTEFCFRSVWCTCGLPPADVAIVKAAVDEREELSNIKSLCLVPFYYETALEQGNISEEEHHRKMGMWWTSPCDCAVESLVPQEYGYESGSETSGIEPEAQEGIEPEAQEMNEHEAGIEPMEAADAADPEA